jgi:SAM-dependent methyltransferase
MAADVHSAAEFYGTPCGGMTARLLRERLAAFWPELPGQSVLGLGYAAPYLRLWREGAARCVAVTPAQIGAARWPSRAPNLACTAEEDALPFPDLCFDRVLVVHGVEGAENARRALREVWRVLKDDGRMIVVAPNRTGLWAHLEHTPFGQGQPYSPGQIGRLLSASMFRVERRDWALYLPPTRLRLALRGARLWERAGRAALPAFGGVVIVEAVKDVYAAVPADAKPRRRLVLADAG